MKADSYDSLPIEKTLTLHNVIILIKSVPDKDKNHYYISLLYPYYIFRKMFVSIS